MKKMAIVIAAVLLVGCVALAEAAARMDAWSCRAGTPETPIVCTFVGIDLVQAQDKEIEPAYAKMLELKVKDFMESERQGCATVLEEAFGNVNVATGAIGAVYLRTKVSCSAPGPANMVSSVSTSRVRLDCAKSLHRYYESGFDYKNGSAPMHWDSQGTSRPLPWAPFDDGWPAMAPRLRKFCEQRNGAPR